MSDLLTDPSFQDALVDVLAGEKMVIFDGFTVQTIRIDPGDPIIAFAEAAEQQIKRTATEISDLINSVNGRWFDFLGDIGAYILSRRATAEAGILCAVVENLTEDVYFITEVGHHEDEDGPIEVGVELEEARQGMETLRAVVQTLKKLEHFLGDDSDHLAGECGCFETTPEEPVEEPNDHYSDSCPLCP